MDAVQKRFYLQQKESDLRELSEALDRMQSEQAEHQRSGYETLERCYLDARSALEHANDSHEDDWDATSQRVDSSFSIAFEKMRTLGLRP